MNLQVFTKEVFGVITNEAKQWVTNNPPKEAQTFEEYYALYCWCVLHREGFAAGKA